jgi:hypothetical protein
MYPDRAGLAASNRNPARHDQYQESMSGMENFDCRVAVQFTVFPLRVLG